MKKSEEIQKLLEKLITSGQVGPEIVQKIQNSLEDPNAMKEIYRLIKDFAGPELEEPLHIEDYYHEGDGSLFNQIWPLSPSIPMPMPFNELDRKTQFFVLFSEWQRRETEGMVELNSGQLDTAENTFRECLERAEQIEVTELEARSYEGLMRIAQRRNDRNAEMNYSRLAQDARNRRS